MAVTFNTIPTKRLATTIDGTAAFLKLNNILDWSGTDLTSAYLGDLMYAVLRDQDNTVIEIMQLDPTTIANNSTTGITILRRGLKFNGDLTTEVTANKLVWVKNQTIVEIGSDVPQIFGNFVNITADQTVAGIKTFSSLPATTGGNPVGVNDLARKAYVDSVVAGIASTINVIVPGTAGETLVAGNAVYLKSSDGRWWKTAAGTSTTVENVIVGIAQGAGSAGSSVTNGILLSGLDSNQSGLTASTKYYFGNTSGAFSTSAGTKNVTAGISHPTDATKLYFFPRFDQQLTADLQSAIGGNNGIPSSSNKLITQTGFQLDAEKYVADASGSSTAYTATLSPAPAALSTGMTIYVKIGLANTTTTPTLNVNGLGAKTIVKAVSTALTAGDIAANMHCTFRYDGTNFVLMNPVAGAGQIMIASASDNLKLSADTNRNHNNDGTVLVKSIRVNYGGIIRIKFDGQGNGFGGQGRIYVNGVATGTTRSFANGSYTTYSEDITINASDLVQIYSIATGGSVTDIRNFRIYFDLTAGGDGTVITD